MSRLIDLTNQKFNRLTVIERDTEYEKTIKNKDAYWKCKCDCGNYKTVSSSISIPSLFIISVSFLYPIFSLTHIIY